MRHAILEYIPEVQNRGSNEQPALYYFIEGLADSPYEFWPDVKTNCFVNKLTGFVVVLGDRLEVSNDACVLPTATALFFVQILKPSLFGDGLAVVYSWRTDF